MKFGKSLSNQIEETLPAWRDMFLSYKDLKKRLKLIDSGERSAKKPRLEFEPELELSSSSSSSSCVCSDEAMTREQIDFKRLLEAEIEKFNGFFMDKEEEYIIKLKEFQDRMVKAEESDEEYIKVRKDIVDFHGEMVLLENYSALNYTGLVKILKKYEKRTGSLIRLPFIQNLLQQPFYNTDLLYKLVKECEIMLDQLFPIATLSVPSEVANGNEGHNPEPTTIANKDGLLRGPKELAEIEYMKSLYMKSTVSALRILKEIRSRSSTVSVFSLPPLQNSGLEGSWNHLSALEEVAK